MTPTRARTLLATAVVAAFLAWALLRLVYVSLPPLPWTGVPALLLLAIAEAWSGRNLRSRLRGRSVGGKPVEPIAVARMAAFAKASSLAAAVVGGLAAGFLIFVSASLDKAAYRSDAYAAGGTLGSAVLLTAAALYLEYSCRVPTPRGKTDERREGDGGPPPP